MNGAQALLITLVDCGVEVCFANPGTTEIYSVAALDAVDGMRGVLTLFEGDATGAADGYARIADRPAAVLLHLGPVWVTAWRTCTTRSGPVCRWSWWSVTTRPTTSTTTRRWNPTSTR